MEPVLEAIERSWAAHWPDLPDAASRLLQQGSAPWPAPQDVQSNNDLLNPRDVFVRVEGVVMRRRFIPDPTQLAQEVITTDNVCAKLFHFLQTHNADQTTLARQFLQSYWGLPNQDVEWIIGEYYRHSFAKAKRTTNAQTSDKVTESKAPDRDEILAQRRKVFNAEQRNLLADDRVQKLRDRYQEGAQSTDGTHFSAKAEVALYFLEHATPASASTNPEEADVDLLDEDEIEKRLQSSDVRVPAIYRDRRWFGKTRRLRTALDIMDDHQEKNEEQTISVHDTGEQRTAPEVKWGPLKTAINRMENPTQYPINLLSIALSHDPAPEPLCRLASTLHEAVAHSQIRRYADGIGKPKLDSRLMNSSLTTSIELKEVTSDIHTSSQFAVYGQAGAFSGAHADYPAPITYAEVQSNTPFDMLQRRTRWHKSDKFYSCYGDEEVLKLWCIVRLDQLTQAERDKQLQAFARDGHEWKPPVHLIRSVALIRGDVLIMPPMTIHAPITVTNCMLLGGMRMSPPLLRRTMMGWRFLTDNRMATNEDTAYQSRSVLDELMIMIHKRPQDYGYGALIGDQDHASLELAKCSRAIGDTEVRCGCKGSCESSSCKCAKVKERCGPRCHASNKGGACKNPWGHEGNPRAHIEAGVLCRVEHGAIIARPEGRVADDEAATPAAALKKKTGSKVTASRTSIDPTGRVQTVDTGDKATPTRKRDASEAMGPSASSSRQNRPRLTKLTAPGRWSKDTDNTDIRNPATEAVAEGATEDADRDDGMSLSSQN